jgi:hypothetical protein
MEKNDMKEVFINRYKKFRTDELLLFFTKEYFDSPFINSNPIRINGIIDSFINRYNELLKDIEELENSNNHVFKNDLDCISNKYTNKSNIAWLEFLIKHNANFGNVFEHIMRNGYRFENDDIVILLLDKHPSLLEYTDKFKDYNYLIKNLKNDKLAYIIDAIFANRFPISESQLCDYIELYPHRISIFTKYNIIPPVSVLNIFIKSLKNNTIQLSCFFRTLLNIKDENGNSYLPERHILESLFRYDVEILYSILRYTKFIPTEKMLLHSLYINYSVLKKTKIDVQAMYSVYRKICAHNLQTELIDKFYLHLKNK